MPARTLHLTESYVTPRGWMITKNACGARISPLTSTGDPAAVTCIKCKAIHRHRARSERAKQRRVA